MAEAVWKPSDIAKAASSDTAMEQAVRTAFGSRISVHTTNPHAQTLEGHLYTACSRTNILVVVNGINSSTIHHIIPIQSIISFTVLSLPSDRQQQSPPGTVNTSALMSRANAAVVAARERAAKVNWGVEKPTQDLFDALDKQFTARWKAKDIIVMERVVVRSPGYRSEDCKVITKDGEGTLGRVRKVVENERKRIAQREGGKAVKPAVPNLVSAPQGGLRKGG